MTTASAQATYHGTLVAATVDTITLGGYGSHPWKSFQITNRSSTDTIFFTFGATATDAVAPVVAAAETRVVPPNSSNVIQWGGPLVVKLISSGTPPYSIETND